MMKRILCGLVRGYQRFISPWLPKACRFYPSCSEYMIQAITEYGVLRGLVRGGWRILRCNPLCEGGYDPVVPLSAHRLRLTDRNCGRSDRSEPRTAAGSGQ
jgi:uncharacterized protein